MVFIGSCLVALLYLFFRVSMCAIPSVPHLDGPNASDSAIAKHKFRGVQYWKQGVTQNVRTLYETAFARFQIHTVLLEDGKTIIDDWLFCDEADHINVLVEQGDSPPTYIVFRQTKYAIQGESLAILGGLVEPGEEALQAAKRELQEELGMQSENWVSLGSYRVAVNRGGGTTYAFLAGNSRPIQAASNEKHDSTFAIGESEKQKRVVLSREALLGALLNGEFAEIKWTATIALSILKMQQAGIQ